MNFGIIGFGKIARKFASSITHTSNGKIYAIGSRSVDEKDDFLIANPAVKVYKDYDALLDDKNVDAVYIALPHRFHKEWVLKALAKHIPVFCEKPAVLTTADAEEIKVSILDNQTYFLEALKTKFNDGMDQLKKDLISLGKIDKVTASFCFDALSNRDKNSYLFEPVQGGALNDVGSYSIGFILALIDNPVKNVTADVKVVDGIDYYFNATLHFENGIQGVVEGGIDRNTERVATITGENGTITIPMFNRIIDYTIHLNNDESIERHFPIKGDDMTLEIQSFIDDVQSEKIQSEVHNIDDTIRILDVMELIRAESK